MSSIAHAFYTPDLEVESTCDRSKGRRPIEAHCTLIRADRVS